MTLQKLPANKPTSLSSSRQRQQDFPAVPEIVSTDDIISPLTRDRSGVSVNFGDRIASIIRLAFTVVNWLIIFRVVFRLIDAPTSQPLAAAIYRLTEPLVAPFYGLIENPVFEISRRQEVVLEASSLIAVFVIAIAGSIVAQFIRSLIGTPNTATVQKLS
jgi:YggT family protein